jgi:hypothetical protein
MIDAFVRSHQYRRATPPLDIFNRCSRVHRNFFARL